MTPQASSRTEKRSLNAVYCSRNIMGLPILSSSQSPPMSLRSSIGGDPPYADPPYAYDLHLYVIRREEIASKHRR